MTLPWEYEVPGVRLARLRTQLDSTSQSMGDTVTKAVDLEARRRTMEDSLRQFREVERRPTSIRDFQPSPTPFGRFSDSLRLPPGVGQTIGGRDAFFDEATNNVNISPELFGAPSGGGTLAHEGGHARLAGLPNREQALTGLTQALAALPEDERNRFFATAQEVLGQTGQSTIENRFGVGGPEELFADVVAVANVRGPDAVPPSLLAIVERQQPSPFSLDSARPTPEQRLARQGRLTPDPALGRQREPGIPSLVEDVFRQTGRVAGGPEEAFLPENVGGLAPPIPTQLVSLENRAATRYAELLTETRQSFPARTPPGTTIESLALERLEEEFGDEFRAAQPQEKRGPVETLLRNTISGNVLKGLGKGLGAGVGFLETKELGGGGFFRDPGTGKTPFEEGAEISRPIVRGAQPIAAEPFEQVEAAGIPVVSPAAGGVATAIESQIVEDIATEVINPAALVLVAPIALSAAAGLRGGPAAAALVSNLLGTGMEPALVRSTLRGLTLLSREGLAALPRISKAVRSTAIFQDAVRGIKAGEAGGGRLAGDVPRGSPGDELIEMLTVRGKESPEIFEETKRLVGEEFGVRSGRAVALRDELIAQGISPQEATLKATAELRGEMPFRAVSGLDLTPAHEAFLWDKLMTNPEVLYGEQANVAAYFQTMQRQIAAGEKVKDFPPFIYRILGKGLGKDFVEQFQQVVKLRVKAVTELSEEAAAARLAKAPTPKGVTDKTPLPPEIPVGEQLQLQRGVPGAAPAPGPQRTAVEGQQFRAEIELEASPKPKGISPGEVADPTGAEQGILRDAAEQFPAPGVDLQGVQVAQRETFLDLLSNTVGILKPLLSSLDISWFRQIGKTITRHPSHAFQSLRRGTTALWSKEKAIAWMDALKAEGSTTTGYRQLIRTEEGTREIALGKLLEDRYMSIPGTPGFGETPLTSRPEFFMSEAAQTVPGIRQSGRGFAVGWNTNYQGTARYWLDKLTKMNGGALTQKQVDASLNLQERITGVGRLGSDNSWFVKALKVMGFAPGFRVSGPEAWMTLLSPRTDPLIRRQAAEQLLSWAAMGNGILTALKYGAGATVVTELGASQFGRVKFPGSDTYYNIWGTDNVLARAVLQAIKQQRIDVKGNISTVGSGEKTPSGFLSSFTDASLSYLKSGEAPAIGLFEELRTGETFIGKKLGWDVESVGEVLKNRLPIVLQDFMDLLQTEGPLQTLFSVPGTLTGTTGVTSYTPTRETFRAIPKYDSANKELVESMLDRKIPEALNLTANEERTLLRFLRVDVKEWVEDLEDKHGPIPSRVSMEQVILKVAKEKGLSGREITGAIFLHKAKSNTDALNKEWIKFALKNRAALEDYYPSSYEADYMQAAQQRAEGLGLVPVR